MIPTTWFPILRSLEKVVKGVSEKWLRKLTVLSYKSVIPKKGTDWKEVEDFKLYQSWCNM